MISLTICVTFASILTLSTVAASAEPSLSLCVSGPQTVEGVENLILTTTIANICNETLKLLNDPRGPLSKAPTDTFDIKGSADTKPLFIGIEVEYDPFKVVINGSQDAFTTLAPGESAVVEHDLSEVYNFTQIGPGSYNFEAHNLFYYVDPSTSAVISIYADSVAHRGWISGKLALIRQSPASSTWLQKRVYHGCSTTEQTSIQAAANNAKGDVASSVTYMQTHKSPDARYTTWFGGYTAQRGEAVSLGFAKLSNIKFSALSYDCTCTIGTQYAWVTRSTGPLIHICPLFWTADLNEMTGILIMEASHWTAVADTHDYAWSAADCQALALSNPDEAVDNAASFAYFAVNIANQNIP